MWPEKIKHSLGSHLYAVYPLFTIISVVIISCRISAVSRAHLWHKIPSPWSTVVAFGDSFSDSGNAAHITGGKYPSEPWYWHHRFSNGPNWIDNLILDLGGLSKIKMRNFAHGAATSDNAFLQGNLLGHQIPGTHQQVRGFMLKSRQSGYPTPDSTLYTVWTGASDCLALGGLGSFNANRNFTTADIHESIFQNILQLERESHNKVSHVLILTPPPVEDMPMVKSEKSSAARPAIQRATESLTRELPYALLERFTTLGRTVMTDNFKTAPMHPPPLLPNHRKRAASPITYYLSVDLPSTYDHTIPNEHNGTKSTTPSRQPRALRKRDNVAADIDGHSHPMPDASHSNIAAIRAKSAASTDKNSGNGRKLEIMVYDAYHFIKHAEENPACFDLNPAMVGQTCGEQHGCYDRVWLDDSNINTSIHYWMARDINVRLHMWHLHTSGVNIQKVFKNSTRAQELELEMLGYACPMRPAPIVF
ncbi:hypothetical protein GGI04_002401 [Coemansia thaxteri]|nr:hypothetical protein GGI04_002401 [Coemansia thaxteri]KAJ2471690.1 hypothetical protein GGI02_002099 [Coemansia sp. RSA 2322]KAJ2484480.1 hypothetical protein EV174_002404 [Coemansia sp. RSA 2320]